MVKFSFKTKLSNYSYQSPFYVCNNNTDECSYYVKSYEFNKGVN